MTVLNPHAAIRVETIGAEGQPVIVIDDVLADAARWRDYAEMLAFAPIGPFYPGVRAVVPEGWADDLRDDLAPLIGETFDLDPVPGVHEAFFSLVTTPPGALQPIQRLPHYDGLELARIAVLIYLSGAEQGGTAFFRQRATAFETVDEGRFATFKQALDTDIARDGVPPPGYIGNDSALFERIAVFDAVPNRALVYRSHALHCAAIPPGASLSADPATGRLSVNLFLFDAR